MPIRLIHVGAGTRGRHWLEIVRDFPDAVSAAVVDPDARAREAAPRHAGGGRIEVFADLDTALARVETDAALVATPSTAHVEPALRCLAANLHVMVEKPLAPCVADARRLLAEAERRGRCLMVAENFRFFQAERTVRRLLDAGRAGELRTVTVIDRRPQAPSDLGDGAAAQPYPQLLEIAVHHFDSFRYLFGREPVSVTARAFNPPGSAYASGAGTAALIEMAGGLPIQYFAVLTSHRYEYSLWIEGEAGSLWTDRRRVWWRARGARFFRPVPLVPVPKGDEQRYPRAGTSSLLAHLRDAVLHGAEPETSGRDNLRSLALVESAVRSSREARTVRVDELTEPPPDNHSVSEPGNRALEDRPISARRRPRVLVIGLDSADAGLIERWCEEGHLPVLQSLREKGVWGRLGTTADTLHVSAWPSLYTGTGPDQHGLYHAYVMKAGVQHPQRPRPADSPQPVFWKLLGDAGRRCVVMDAFMSCPLAGFSGAQILEHGTWTHFGERATAPPELGEQILAKFGPYPAEHHGQVMTIPDSPGFRDRLVRGARWKGEVVRWLMGRQPWDLVFAVFAEPHPAGHYLWHLHDPGYPAHPAGGAGALGSALRDVYVAVDRALGRIVSAAPEDAVVLVVSGDGMGPNYSGSHVLDALLEQRGLFTSGAARERAAPPGAGQGGKGRKSLVKRVRNLVPTSLRHAISRHLLPDFVNERLAIRWMTADIHWPATRAFPISNANEGYIRINLKGREPEGVVAPGAEYEGLCETLVRVLSGLTNPRTGRSAIRRVRRAGDIYSGPCRDSLPDVIVNWDPSAEVTTELLAEGGGLVRTEKAGYALPPYYVGNHRPAAFVVAQGPGIAAGKVLAGGHILDLAPTLLAHFGVDRTPAMKGSVLDELLPPAE